VICNWSAPAKCDLMQFVQLGVVFGPCGKLDDSEVGVDCANHIKDLYQGMTLLEGIVLVELFGC